jgi:hypothetical protein
MNDYDDLIARLEYHKVYECDEAAEAIRELQRQLANEQARGIHTCTPNCTREGCVNRRLRELLREARDEMRAMERLHNGYYASLEKIDEALK